jgi:hypothetical protein
VLTHARPGSGSRVAPRDGVVRRTTRRPNEQADAGSPANHHHWRRHARAGQGDARLLPGQHSNSVLVSSADQNPSEGGRRIRRRDDGHLYAVLASPTLDAARAAMIRAAER